MSNKNTPKINKNSTFCFQTPIKERKLNFNPKSLEEKEYQNTNPLNSPFFNDDKKEESGYKKFVDEPASAWLASPHVMNPKLNSNFKIFQSPSTNQLAQSPYSFENLLNNNISRCNSIDLLNFKNRQNININLNQKINAAADGTSPSNNIDAPLNHKDEGNSKNFKQKNNKKSKKSKFPSKDSSNKPEEIIKLNANDNKNIYLDKKMSAEKIKKIKVNKEEKENIYPQENESNTNSNSSLLDINKVNSNISYTSGNLSIINVNSNKKPFESHRTTFKNLIPDLNNISKDNSFRSDNNSHSNFMDNNSNLNLHLNENNKNFYYIDMKNNNNRIEKKTFRKIKENSLENEINIDLNNKQNLNNNSEICKRRCDSNSDTSSNQFFPLTNPNNLQSPVIIKNKIIIDSKNDSSQNKIRPNNLKDYLSPLRFSSGKKKIFNISEVNDSTFNTSQKKIKKRLRKTSHQLECLENCYKNADWLKEKELKENISDASAKTGLPFTKVYKWIWDQKNKEVLEKNKNLIFQVKNF
jgi:hypothetical protein